MYAFSGDYPATIYDVESRLAEYGNREFTEVVAAPRTIQNLFSPWFTPEDNVKVALGTIEFRTGVIRFTSDSALPESVILFR